MGRAYQCGPGVRTRWCSGRLAAADPAQGSQAGVEPRQAVATERMRITEASHDPFTRSGRRQLRQPAGLTPATALLEEKIAVTRPEGAGNRAP